MDERTKELIAIFMGVSLCASVFGYGVYVVYVSHREYNVEFKVFEATYWDVRGRSETQILTWGVGKYYFLGNWTGQFKEGQTYNVTFVQQRGSSLRTYRDLIVLSWEDVS